MKPKTQALGQVTVERDGPGYVYLLPDGTTGAGTRQQVERAVQRWAAAHTEPDAVSELQIVWPD